MFESQSSQRTNIQQPLIIQTLKDLKLNTWRRYTPRGSVPSRKISALRQNWRYLFIINMLLIFLPIHAVPPDRACQPRHALTSLYPAAVRCNSRRVSPKPRPHHWARTRALYRL